MDTDNHIIVLLNLDRGSEEQTAALAGALGITVFEARRRVAPPAPRVVAIRADAAAAAQLAAVLEGAGFAAAILRHKDIDGEGDRVLVRSFTFHPAGLKVETRSGDHRAVRYDQIRLLLQGQNVRQGMETETSSRRRLALGKALVTGGMVMTKKEKTSKTTVHETGGPFLMLYADGHPTLSFREAELQYQGLGAALKPSRTANFRRLVAALRTSAGTARWDGQLLTAAGQRHVLGGVLTPVQDLDVALALLAR